MNSQLPAEGQYIFPKGSITSTVVLRQLRLSLENSRINSTYLA
jgi:hypothetical protein